MARALRFLLPILALVAACASPTAPDITGRWGSSSASMTLRLDGGTVTLPCAAGTIDPGWTLASDGTFSATGGIYGTAGPVPAGGGPLAPATFDGHVQGDRMSLTVTLTGSGLTYGPYELRKGGPQAYGACV